VININFDQTSRDPMSSIPWKQIASLVHKDFM
jgi:hypothetical protein